MDRELEGDAARLADAFAHALRQHDVMAVAGREVGAGLGDADERLAGLQLLARQAPVHVALDVERGHVRIVRIVEPDLRPELYLRAVLGVERHWNPPGFAGKLARRRSEINGYHAARDAKV